MILFTTAKINYEYNYIANENWSLQPRKHIDGKINLKQLKRVSSVTQNNEGVIMHAYLLFIKKSFDALSNSK